MLRKRIHHKKDRRVKKLRRFVLIEIVFLVLLIIFEILYFGLFTNKLEILNPLSLHKQSSTYNLGSRLKSAQIEYSKIILNKDFTYTVELKNNAIIYFSEQKNINEQISSLQLILERLKIEGKQLKSLNFKYDSPVIKF